MILPALLMLVGQPVCSLEPVAVLDFVADIHVQPSELRQSGFSEEELFVFLRKGASGLLQDVLSGYLPVVEREQLSGILERLELESTDLFDQATVVQVGGWVGARYSVMGSWVKLGEVLTLRARMVDNTTAVIVASQDGSVSLGQPQTMLDLAGKVGWELLAGVGVRVQPAVRPTESVEVLKEYSQAIAASDRGDRDAAEEHARVALALDPGFERARRYVRGTASQLQTLGYHTQTAAIEMELRKETGDWLRSRRSTVTWGPLMITTIFGGGMAIANSFLSFSDSRNALIMLPGLIISGVGLAGSLIGFPKAPAAKVKYVVDDATGDVLNILCLRYLQEMIAEGRIRQTRISGAPNPGELAVKDIGEIIPMPRLGYYLCKYDCVVEAASAKYRQLTASFYYTVRHDGTRWVFEEMSEEEYLNLIVNARFEHPHMRQR